MAGKHRGQPSQGEVQLELQDRRVRLSEQREARFSRAQEQREARQAESSSSGPSLGSVASAPGRAASAITSAPYSGKGLLAAELLIGFALVAIRLVADAEVADDGTTVKAKVLHQQGEYGPIPILIGLIITFFVLSFVAAGGGTRAKLAVIFGGIIITALAVNSYSQIQFIAGVFGSIGQISAPAPAGQMGDIFGNAGTPGTPPPAKGYASNPLPTAPGQPAGTGKLPGSPNTITIPFFGEPLTIPVPAVVGNAEKDTANTIKGWISSAISHLHL